MVRGGVHNSADLNAVTLEVKGAIMDFENHGEVTMKGVNLATLVTDDFAHV